MLAIDMTQGTQITPSVKTARQPQRQRGVVRFEHLLDSAEYLLSMPPDRDLSLAMVAKQAQVPLPSIYNFFPNRNTIFVALAARFHAQLEKTAGEPLAETVTCWQDIVRYRQRSGAEFLNRHPAALRLFMGAGVSVDVRNLDLMGNANLAQRRAAEFERLFDCSGISDLAHHIAISIGVMDGVWAISYSRHRYITDQFLAESTRAAVAYLRCYLPEFLTSREIFDRS